MQPPETPRRAWRLASPFLAPVLLLALLIGFHWRLTLTRTHTWLDNPDLAYQAMPWFQFQAAEIHQGRVPLWDPNHWGGQTLIGQVQPGTAYPLNWILFALPLRDGRIRLAFLDCYFLLIHFMGALFAYWLCRDLRRSRTASLLSGACFALGGLLGNALWPGVINGVVWTPLVFLFLLRVSRGRNPLSSAALSGVFCGIAFLAGHHQVPIVLLLATGGVWIYLVFRNRRLDWRLARLGALALAFTLLAGALQFLPAYEYGVRAIRWVGVPDAVEWNQRVPYSVHSELSLQASSLLGVLVAGTHRHENPFLGITLISLAFLGVALRWRWRSVRVLAAVALGGLLFALGRDAIFHGVLYAVVPLVEKARQPARAMFLFDLAAVVLMACGFDALRRGQAWLRRVSVTLSVLGVLASFSFVIAIKYQLPLDDKLVLSALVALLLAGLYYGIYRGRISRRAAGVCFLGLALFELGFGSGPPLSLKSQASTLNRLRDHGDVVAFLRRQPGPFRVEVDDQEIPYNFGDWNDFQDMGGYLASVPLNVWRMGGVVDRSALYGVAYTVTKKPLAGRQQLVFESSGGLKVYRNPAAYPRLWTVHRSADALFPAGALPLEVCSGADSLRLIEYTPGRVVIEAAMACRGLVVLSDNHFPGWRATLDGQTAAILPAYLSMRGVIAPPGRHRIAMEYHPWSVRLGALLSLLGVLGAAALAVRDRLRFKPS